MKKVIIAGGGGFLGSYLAPLFQDSGYDVFVPRSAHYDLRQVDDIRKMFSYMGQTDIVINLAANVGGIGYNQNHPYALFYDNAMIGINLINEAIRHNVEKFVQIGTICSYPKWSRPPFNEKMLWDGYPEETNAPYGLAKKMLLIQLQAARQEHNFNGIYLMPTNLYGPRDEFMAYRSHVIPAMIKAFTEAKMLDHNQVTMWGSGKVSRDFLFVEDAARAIFMATEKYNRLEPLNIGTGDETYINYLAGLIGGLTGFEGLIKWDTSKPDGQPARGVDIRAIKDAIEWQPEVKLRDGLERTIKWYQEEIYAVS
jgi:nucleoside-diphosphate-sugar epimerase